MKGFNLFLICFFGILFFFFFVMIILANIEVSMFLKPNSFWWKIVPWIEKYPDTPEAKKIAENKKVLLSSVQNWMDNTENIDIFFKSTKDKVKIHCKYYPNVSDKWVICVHGYRGDLPAIGCYGMEYYKNGYNIILIDNRAHGLSDGKYIGMGYLEQFDVRDCIDYILRIDKNAKIVIHGESLGGTTVMLLAGMELPVNVKCLVEDSGYTSAWRIFSDLRKKFMKNVPDFPMLYIDSLFAKFRAGYSFKECSVAYTLPRCKIPIYFLHGGNDDFVKTKMIYDNYSLTECEKDWFIFPYSGHCESKFYDNDLYWKKIFSFIEKFME